MRLSLLWLPLVGSACLPSAHMRVLQPAELVVPHHVATVAVVDRSKAKNAGEGVLGILEGALSGETIGADTEGRAGAMEGLVMILEESPRFVVIQGGWGPLDSSLFDKPMPWSEARAMCASVGCQGIVALEAFDSDGSTTIQTSESTEDVDGKDTVVTTYEALRDTTVHTTWRLYDVQNKVIVDDLHTDSQTSSSSYEADTEADARSGLPDDGQVVHDFGFASGEAYGRRIAPNYVWVTRSFYAKGDRRMKDAKKLAKADQWDEAEVVWRELYRATGDEKLKAKLAYNVAVSHEVKGQLHKALGWQEKAAGHWSKGRIQAYGALLAGRLADAQTLRETMPGGTE